METDDRYTRITLRIPKDLHARLATSAEDTSKSMNAEIVARLEYTMLLDSEMAARTSGDFDYSDTLSWLAGSESEADAFLKERNELERNPTVLDAADIAEQVERRLHGSDLEKLNLITALLLAFPDAVTESHRNTLLDIASRIFGITRKRPTPLAALTMGLVNLGAEVSLRAEESPAKPGE